MIFIVVILTTVAGFALGALGTRQHYTNKIRTMENDHKPAISAAWNQGYEGGYESASTNPANVLKNYKKLYPDTKR